MAKWTGVPLFLFRSGWSHAFDEQKKAHVRYIFPNAYVSSFYCLLACVFLLLFELHSLWCSHPAEWCDGLPFYPCVCNFSQAFSGPIAHDIEFLLISVTWIPHNARVISAWALSVFFKAALTLQFYWSSLFQVESCPWLLPFRRTSRCCFWD